jgi:predicted dehydrogenase
MDKVKLGLIGVGVIGNYHLGNIARLETVELTAVCDIIPERAQAAAEKFQCRAYTESQALLDEHHCEAVLIATPHYAHTTIGIAALEAGYHVLVEKPISVHKADCERLIAANQDRRLVFAAMFQQRVDPHFRKIKELLEGGELGELLRIHWILTDWFRTEAYYASSHWRATWKGEGGGVLLNQAMHNLDMWQWLFGMPDKVWGHCRFGQRHKIEVEDEVTAYLEYGNGCRGVFTTSTGEAPGANRLEIAGERGKLVLENGALTFARNEVPAIDFLRTSKSLYDLPPVTMIPFSLDSPSDLHAAVLANFVNAIQTGAELIAPAEEGIHSVELANAMIYSTVTGKPVNLPLDGQEYEQLLKRLIVAASLPTDL